MKVHRRYKQYITTITMHLDYSTYVCKNETRATATCSVFTLLLHTAQPDRQCINEHNIVQRRFDVHVG